MTDYPDSFALFASNAAGRYAAAESDDAVVLDLIPAFGRLFASVGHYMNGKSLYSYYAAEILPLCPAGNENCPYNHSQISYDAYIRFFSNMSYAGEYWPGETFQRLTIVPGGIMISDYVGDGDGLVSKKNMLLSRSDAAPSMFIYGPADAENIFGSGIKPAPKALTGSRKAAWQTEEGNISVQFSIESDGSICLLKDIDNGRPPLLLKGGVSVSENGNDGQKFCYIMSSPSSGTMPVTGCVSLKARGEQLLIKSLPDSSDDLFIPENASEAIYGRN